jgi:thymidylate synthase (FAD)
MTDREARYNMTIRSAEDGRTTGWIRTPLASHYEPHQNTIGECQVLGSGAVRLIETLPRVCCLDAWVARSARQSTARSTTPSTPERDARLIAYLLHNGHTSPFEQVVFTFELDVPLLVWWHIVRHRTARLSMESGRYHKLREWYYAPSVWYAPDPQNKQMSGEPLDEDTQRACSEILQRHWHESYALYEQLLEKGVAREQARLVLPAWCVFYRGFWQIDAHNLMRFLLNRTDRAAQVETREVAQAIEWLFARAMPVTHDAYTRWRDAQYAMRAELAEERRRGG